MTEMARRKPTRSAAKGQVRRTLSAVVISALVALGVAAPLAMRVLDEEPSAPSNEGPVATAPASTATTSSTTTSSTTTVPVNVLGTSTVHGEEQPGG
ncbi:MAG: hypothetical protein ACK5O2_04975 [Microthrixaceae bacterium]